LDGQGTGNSPISVYGHVNLTVDGCKLEGFTEIGISFSSEAAQNGLVTNTVIDGGNAANEGVLLSFGSGPDAVALDHVTIKGTVGVAVIDFSAGGVIQVTNSVVTQNAFGVETDGFGSTISVANTAITANQTAVCSGSGSKIRLDTNDIYDSATAAIQNCGGQIKTSGTNRTSGAILIPSSDVSNTVLF
jgi:hypothetical protein